MIEDICIMIRLVDACRTYKDGNDEVYALDHVNLEIKANEFVSIMGVSGAGKTTLLNVLGGMDRLTSGSYIYDGVEIESFDNREMISFRKKNVGFVFQDFALLNNYTVYENVEFPLLVSKVNAKDRRDKIYDILKKVGIEKLAEKKPVKLSRGQCQRCAIARAMVTGCNLILADEPTGSLDTHTMESIMILFKEFHESGRTIILVTHDERVASYAERTIFIADGKIIQYR